MTIFNLDETVRIKRFKASTGNIKIPVTTATADASIQQLGKQGGVVEEGVFGEEFICYLEVDIDVQNGDLLVDSNSRTYTVRNVITREFGANPYKEVVIVLRQ